MDIYLQNMTFDCVSWIFCQLLLSKPLLKLSETLYEIVKQREPATQQAVWRSKKRQGEMVCVLNNSPNTWQATVGYQKMEWNKDDDKNIKAAVSFWTSSPFFEGPWSKVWSFHTRKYAAALLSTYQVFYRPFRRCSAYERSSHRCKIYGSSGFLPHKKWLTFCVTPMYQRVIRWVEKVVSHQ